MTYTCANCGQQYKETEAGFYITEYVKKDIMSMTDKELKLDRGSQEHHGIEKMVANLEDDDCFFYSFKKIKKLKDNQKKALAVSKKINRAILSKLKEQEQDPEQNMQDKSCLSAAETYFEKNIQRYNQSYFCNFILEELDAGGWVLKKGESDEVESRCPRCLRKIEYPTEEVSFTVEIHDNCFNYINYMRKTPSLKLEVTEVQNDRPNILRISSNTNHQLSPTIHNSNSGLPNPDFYLYCITSEEFLAYSGSKLGSDLSKIKNSVKKQDLPDGICIIELTGDNSFTKEISEILPEIKEDLSNMPEKMDETKFYEHYRELKQLLYYKNHSFIEEFEDSFYNTCYIAISEYGRYAGDEETKYKRNYMLPIWWMHTVKENSGTICSIKEKNKEHILDHLYLRI